MSKVQFKAQFNVDGDIKLFTLNGEEHDKFTYYTSKRMNTEFNRPMSPYCLYDKNTGLPVAYGKTKNELFENYKKVSDRYDSVRNSREYRTYIDRYERLKKDGTNLEVINDD